MSEGIAADLAKILSAVVTEIRTLTDDEVKALVTGEAEFRLVPKAAPRRATTRATTEPTTHKPATDKPTTDRMATDSPAPDVDRAAVRDALAAATSDAEATTYLKGLKLSLPAAKSLATDLGLRLPARPSVASISAEIIRVFVAGRLNRVTVQRL
jgi:hypothetical protein